MMTMSTTTITTRGGDTCHYYYNLHVIISKTKTIQPFGYPERHCTLGLKVHNFISSWGLIFNASIFGVPVVGFVVRFAAQQ